MRIGGRLAAAIEILGDLDARHRPAAEALKDWGNAHRFAGSADRAAIGNLVFDALRQRRSLAWRMRNDTPRALVLGVFAHLWGETADTLAAALADDPHAPEGLNDGEREALEIPPGTQTGKVFRKRGQGIPRLQRNGRGDMQVTVRVQVPTNLTPEQRELFRILATTLGDATTEQHKSFFDRIFGGND